MADRANLTIYQGDDYASIVTVTGDAPPEDVLAGCSAQAQLRAATGAVIEFSTLINSPQITFWLSHDQTVLLPDRQYSWDMQLITAGGSVTTLLLGYAEVIRP